MHGCRVNSSGTRLRNHTFGLRMRSSTCLIIKPTTPPLKALPLWFAFPLLLLSLACEWHGGGYPTAPATISIIVHGMITLGEQRQEIILEYSRGIGDGYFMGLTPVDGAQVEVVGGGQAHPFLEDPARPGVYLADFVPQPRQRYMLQVRVPTGDVLTAETLVPDVPRAVPPGLDTTISWGDHISLSWFPAVGAAGYVFGSYSQGTPSSINSLQLPTILSDTTITVQPWVGGGATYRYRVAAVDSNYLHYLKFETGTDATFSTVKGGYGLFGAYALSTGWSISVQ